MRIPNEAYFDWLLGLIGESGRCRQKLCRLLYETPFVYTIGLDSNREKDGLNLRCQYYCENGLAFPTREPLELCSVLEMMIALAKRCEDYITDDPELGNRTGVWFEAMLESLELDRMTDARYREAIARRRIERFLTRQYRPDGRGGLFTLRSCAYDLREVEIWYQMMWYLNENVYERR